MIRTATEHEREPQEGATAIEAPDNSLWRYARWQLKDFAVQKAPFLLLVAILMLYPLVASFFIVSPSLERFAANMRESWIYIMFGMLTLLGTLAATRGIVSEDRQQGFHRFLFAKPIGLARYYAQQFGVAGVGVMGVLAIVGALYALTISPFVASAAFVPAAVFFVLFGGVTFLFSTVSRFDWVWTLGAVAASAWTRYLVEARGWSLLAPLEAILLPIGSFPEMARRWAAVMLEDGSVAAALASSAWPLAYGAAAFGVGLWILRRRAIVR